MLEIDTERLCFKAVSFPEVSFHVFVQAWKSILAEYLIKRPQ